MAIVSSLFIRWGIRKFTFIAYRVQFDGDSNSVKSSLKVYFGGEYYYHRQITIYMLLSKLQNSKCGITVRIQKIKKDKK